MVADYIRCAAAHPTPAAHGTRLGMTRELVRFTEGWLGVAGGRPAAVEPAHNRFIWEY